MVTCSRVSIGSFLYFKDEDIWAVGPSLMNNHVRNYKGPPLLVPEIGAIVRESQPFWHIAVPIVFNVYSVLGKHTLQIHGKPRCDTTFTQVVL
jgi:hypothetical protein